MKYQIIFVRHGDSTWNFDNKFCGWYDAPLSLQGLQEASQIADTILQEKLNFNIAFTSCLTRANQTLDIILEHMKCQKDIFSSTQENSVPVIKNWRLNERHYGGLTGWTKTTAVEKFGLEQVKIWRRSFDVLPPDISEANPYFGSIAEQVARWNQDSEEPIPLPTSESLKTTLDRVLPFWYDTIVPNLRKYKTALVVAHGTSLRALVKHLDNLDVPTITKLNLPNGMPFIYEFDENFNPITSLKFLSDAKTVQAKMKEIANQITQKS